MDEHSQAPEKNQAQAFHFLEWDKQLESFLLCGSFLFVESCVAGTVYALRSSSRNSL